MEIRVEINDGEVKRARGLKLMVVIFVAVPIVSRPPRARPVERFSAGVGLLLSLFSITWPDMFFGRHRMTCSLLAGMPVLKEYREIFCMIPSIFPYFHDTY